MSENAESTSVATDVKTLTENEPSLDRDTDESAAEEEGRGPSRDEGEPTLELVSEYPTADERTEGPPLLFVHGAFVGAWCWEEHFLPYFASRGRAAHAVSLRGHGESEGSAHLGTAGLDSYVADLHRTVERFERTPVLVGHSMGGVVVQRYLERHAAPGAVLMASVPPQGMAGASLRMAFRDPTTWWQFGLLQGFGPRATSPRAVRRALFSADLPTERLERYVERAQRESNRALVELAAPTVSGAGRLEDLPTLVLGGDDDAIVPPWAVEATARAHATEAEFVDGLAHAMMLDTGWSRAADAVDTWLDSHQFDEGL